MSRNNKPIQQKQGFTIIEVVLVLAVAGLIFLMVFIALPALQRTQRDTQRRQDMSRVSSALTQYQTNNSTASDNLPGAGVYVPGTTTTFDTSCSSNTACKFVRDYMNEANSSENLFIDPDGAPYQVGIAANLTGTPANSTVGSTVLTCDTAGNCSITASTFSDHAIFIIPGGKCNGETVVRSQKRHFAILMKMEGASVACLDNQ